MAEGFAKHYGREKIEAFSGGSKPAERVDPKAVEVMKEKGIDISDQQPKLVTAEEIEKADYVITMGCGVEVCPVCSDSFVPQGANSPIQVDEKTIEWDLDDPSGKSVEKFREVRDKIEKRVRDLLENLQNNNS
ncbi:hypothetical protein AKJ62_02460 [candidate division MSBL1 archaeon SCGC-AAA259D14]|uniref:Phosphotyrosine protein phosphatase I domain-containing protein n=2 Tax=candidate division MSBL1 TaxID=215777 RepID=A0A133U693_9EURY|nr:hypothetical protein AKJ62_02460 [candidate division MSBL1 archaeon SCGC-AAA259D14]KXA93820.1 hypothetical protein AKJ66_00805 [candidate division MSBL1 archaeon SCGC-AAA259E22]